MPDPVPALEELGQPRSDTETPLAPTTGSAHESPAPAQPFASANDQPTAEPIPDPVPTVEFDQNPEPLPEQAWPNFRNGKDLRGIAVSALPDQPELMWELPTHDGITSTPAIANGKVYVAALSGHVFCLELKTGEEIWRYRTIPNDDPEEFAPGFNAPVTLSAAAVYVGDEDGTLHALDRRTGGRLWTFPTNGEVKGGATILPGDGGSTPERVLFGSHDGRLYCVHAQTGEKLWEFDTLGPVNGSQALDGQFTFVSGCDKPILRVVDIASGEQHAEVPLDGRLLIASPALVDEILYFGTPEGEVVALDWRNQQTKWVYADPDRSQEIHSSPAVTDELVLIGSRDKRLHAIERETGEERWNFETRGPIDSSPVVVGDRVYFGSADRNVYGVNLQGEEVFKYNAGQRISGSPAVGEGCLVIGCEGPDGKILCFGKRE
jgi:outer membrane protein assembly factor BamB